MSDSQNHSENRQGASQAGQPQARSDSFTPRDWDSYFKTILQYPKRPSTERAVTCFKHRNKCTIQPSMIAVDCGCGIGRDTAWLLEQGFTVYAYDNAQQALETCRKRFADNPQLHLGCSSFADYSYPSADLIIANASLFFCPPDEFATSWQKIVSALKPGGVIHIDLLGDQDSWVNDPEFCVTAFSQTEVKQLFADFEIIRFNARNEDGTTAVGTAKHWHSFHILAIKQ